MFRVVTFGSAVVDLFVDTGLAEKGNLMCYNVGSKLLIKNLKSDIGGGGTNTAVAFSRLGLKTGYIGKIGDDVEGKSILALLKKENVVFIGKIDKKERTGISIILDSREHDRTILTYKGANNKLKFGEISFEGLKTDWLYLCSLLGDSFETQKKLALILSKKGTKIAFNPSEYLIENLDLRSILKVCEILVLNKEESELLARKNKIKFKDIFEALHSLGPKFIVITDKNNPILASDGFKKYSLIPHKIKVVERTGAGDAFASGFVAGQIVGWNVQKSLELGLKESESVIRYFGAKNKLLKMNLK